MLIPVSWLKEYVDIKLPLKDLMWKMTEAGLTCESFKKEDGEIVLDVEVTPNRPDWMSVYGVAREISAITGSKLKSPQVKVETKKIKKPLQIKIKPDYKIVPRITSVIVRNVTVKPSPEWLQKRLKQVGLRPINNLVDITNYVLWTYGSLLHVFDYDKIMNHEMAVTLSKGGEPFRSLDGIDYVLPKNAIIIKDDNRVIDLLPLKGGENTASFKETKNVLLHSIVCDPVLTRRTSQALKLRSDSSAIAERGLDPNGTVAAVNHALSLILELAGGEVASEIIDHKLNAFAPWKLKLNLMTLEKVLGIKLKTNEVINILKKLNLSPNLNKNEITCLIPTFRGDLKIEEDLIEEVARIYGYNKFPKTIPSGKVNAKKIPYYFDDRFHLKIKEYLIASGFTEVKTLSLMSKSQINKFGLVENEHIKLTNPVSSEYEYMRTSLIPSLAEGLKMNTQGKVMLFEIDKVYPSENYKVGAMSKGYSFREFKGSLDLILERLNIQNYKLDFETVKSYWHPFKAGSLNIDNKKLGEFGYLSPQVQSNLEITEPVLSFELDINLLENCVKQRIFKPISENPAQIEDLTLVFPPKTRMGEVIQSIKSVSNLISQVNLEDIYKDSFTLRVYYQHPTKTLNDKEVEEIRNKILKEVKEKFGGSLKD